MSVYSALLFFYVFMLVLSNLGSHFNLIINPRVHMLYRLLNMPLPYKLSCHSFDYLHVFIFYI